MNFNRLKAAELIRSHFDCLRGKESNEDVFVSARQAGSKMVEIYRLLTNEMPQAPGIEVEYQPDETPAVEWPSPVERDPNEVLYVLPGDPDIIQKGDQHDTSNGQEGKRSISDGQQGGSIIRSNR